MQNLKIYVDINQTQSLIDPSSIVCNCEISLFKDSYHVHIFTGNLRLIKDQKLRLTKRFRSKI